MHKGQPYQISSSEFGIIQLYTGGTNFNFSLWQQRDDQVYALTLCCEGPQNRAQLKAFILFGDI